MKAKLFFVLILAIAGKASATNQQIDSLRNAIMNSKIDLFRQQINEYSQLIQSTDDEKTIKSNAKKMYLLSENLKHEIRELYEYEEHSDISTIYTGQNTNSSNASILTLFLSTGTTTILSNSPGLALAITNYHTGSLPPIYYEVDRISDYSMGLRIFQNKKIARFSAKKIMKSNNKLKS